jgi:cytochrome c
MKHLIPVAVAAVWLSAGGAALAADGPQLLKEKNCLACHMLEKKLVGPAYKDVAAKYRSRKDAQAYLVGKIRGGSNGVWGPVPMPPNGTVNADEAKTLAAYILTVK